MRRVAAATAAAVAGSVGANLPGTRVAATTEPGGGDVDAAATKWWAPQPSTPAAGSAAEAATPPPGSRALTAVVMFRHGARTPVFAGAFGPGPAPAWNGCWPPRQVHAKAKLDRLQMCLEDDVDDGDDTPSRRTRASRCAPGSHPTATPMNSERRNRDGGLAGTCVSGQLTRVGAVQAEELGALLRARYTALGLLPSVEARRGGGGGGDAGAGGGGAVPRPPLVYARSTRYPRTVETLAAVLTGLRGGDDPTEKQLVYIRDPTSEFLHPNMRRCQRLAELYKRSRSVFRRQVTQTAEARDARRRVGAALRMPPDEVNFVHVRDVITARESSNLPLPLGLASSPDLVARIDKLAAEQVAEILFRANQRDSGGELEHARLGTGRVLAHMLRRINLAVDAYTGETGAGAAHGALVATGGGGRGGGTAATAASADGRPSPPTPLSLYSAHDTTLVTLLGALEAYDDAWPPFCAWLAIEVFVPDNANAHGTAGTPVWAVSRDRDVLVRVLYNGRPVVVGGARNKGGRATLTLAQFRELVEPVTVRPDAFMGECAPTEEGAEASAGLSTGAVL